MCPLSRDTTFDADLVAGQDEFVCSFYCYFSLHAYLPELEHRSPLEMQYTS